MNRRIDVLVDDGRDGRRTVCADLLRASATTVWVELPDGNLVRRKIARDVPEYEQDRLRIGRRWNP